MAGYLVEGVEVKMKASTWIYVFCGYIGMMVQVGPIVKNTGATRVGEFGGRLCYSCVYTKFGHLENMLMGGMSKSLVDEFSIESAAHDHDGWKN